MKQIIGLFLLAPWAFCQDGFVPREQALARAQQLEQEMELSPQAVRHKYVTEERRNRLVARDASLRSLLEERFEATGVVDVMHIDRVNHPPIMALYMTVDGQRVRIYWDGEMPTGLASRATVQVSGYRLGSTFALSTAPTLIRAAGSDCAMTGALQTLVLLMVPPGKTIEPGLAARINEKFFSDSLNSGSLNQFWKQNSFNRVSAKGEVRVVNLAKAYEPSQIDLMRSEMSQWAQTNGITMTSVSRLVLIYPSTFFSGGMIADGVASGGCFAESTGNGTATYGIAWLHGIDARQQDSGAIADVRTSTMYHESGHNFTFNHHRSRTYPNAILEASTVSPTLVEYGGVFSPMATGGSGFFAASHRYLARWLDEGVTMQTVTGPGEFTLAPADSSGPGLRALRIPRGAGNTSFLWLEFRPNSTADLGYVPSRPAPVGAIVNLAGPAGTDFDQNYVDLLDMTPGSPGLDGNSARDAQLIPGASFYDPLTEMTIQALDVSAAGLRVRTSIGAQCGGLLSNSEVTHPPYPSTGVLSLVGPRPNCRPAISSAVGWIQLQAGSINPASIPYTVEINPHAAPRSGIIYVDGRAVRITQAASPWKSLPLLTNWRTNKGTAEGYEDRFDFLFANPNGGKFRTFQLDVRRDGVAEPVCRMLFDFVDDRARINADGVLQFREAPVARRTAQVTNSFCSGRLAGWDTQTSQLISLELAFDRSLEGTVRFEFTTVGMNGETASYPLGQYLVRPNYPAVISNFMTRRFSGTKGTVQFRVEDRNGAGDVSRIAVFIQQDISTDTAAGSCRFTFTPANNTLGLFAGDVMAGSMQQAAIGSGVVLRTSACRIDTGGAKAAAGEFARTVEVPVELTFTPPDRLAVFVSTTRPRFLATVESARYPIATWTLSALPVEGRAATVGLVSTATGNATRALLRAVHPVGVGFIETIESRFGPDAAGNCWLRYVPATQRLSLLDDAGQRWLTEAGVGTEATLENSQCRISAGVVTVGGSASTLEANIPIFFKPTFNGPRAFSVQASATGTELQVSDWSREESVEVSSAPTLYRAGIRPARDAGHHAIWSVELELPATLEGDSVRLLVADSPDKAKSCAITLDLTIARYTLAADNGVDESVPTLLNARRANSQCSVAQLSFQRDFRRVTISVDLFFAPGFVGEKKVYVAPGKAEYGAVGVWSVTADTPPHITLAPRFSDSLEPVFRLKATDAQGFRDLGILLLTARSSEFTCQAGWVASSPTQIFWGGAFYPLPSTQLLRGPHCEVDLSLASVTVEANSVTLALPLRFPSVTQPASLYSSHVTADHLAELRYSPGFHLGTWLPLPSTNPNTPATVTRAEAVRQSVEEVQIEISVADPDGVGDLETIDGVFGMSPDDPAGCRWRYDAVLNAFSVYDFSSDTWSAASPLSIGPVVRSEPCALNPAAFTVSSTETGISLAGPIQVQISRDAPTKAFVRASDRHGATEWLTVTDPNEAMQFRSGRIGVGVERQ